jgi:hypothetical protein
VIELERYLAEHETGLDFAGLMAQVKSPSVKQARHQSHSIKKGPQLCLR